MPDIANLRASDEDRERAAEVLSRHCEAGRLTVDELDARMEAAFAARTIGELAALLDDLPAARSTTAPARPVRARVAPGRIPFSIVADLTSDPRATRQQALEHMAPLLSDHGYRLAGRDEEGLIFEHARRPAWTILVAVFGFPFGLFALLHRTQDRIELDFTPGPGGGTRVLARGVAPRAVRRALIGLRD